MVKMETQRLVIDNCLENRQQSALHREVQLKVQKTSMSRLLKSMKVLKWKRALKGKSKDRSLVTILKLVPTGPFSSSLPLYTSSFKY